MRFGYTVEAPVTWSELLQLAHELDQQSNFDILWIADALVPNGRVDEPRLDAWTALAAIAQATTRIRLGVHVSGNPYRHPAVLAKMVTTLDHISGGRVELGIGAGYPGDNRRFGIEFWKRRERLERLDEAIEVIKLLWTQSQPAFQGRYYQLKEPPYNPPNIQRPHPPILIGGRSDPMLRIIAKHADTASPMDVWLGDAKPKIEAYCQEFGRSPGELRWEGGGYFFMHDDPRVLTETRGALEKQLTEDEIRSAFLGSVDDVRSAVQRFADAGADQINVFQLPRVQLPSLLRFSEEVIPQFR